MTAGRGRIGRLVVGTTVLLATAWLAQRLTDLPPGLSGTYYANPDWQPPAAHEEIDAPPSTFALAAAWNDQRPPSSSAVWRGSLLILRSGQYTFATASDDGSWLSIDDAVVVDNGGAHARRLATGSVALTAGVHRVSVRYFDAGGDAWLDLLWTRGSDALSLIPAWRLRPRMRSTSTVVTAVVVDAVEMALAWTWVAAVVTWIAVWLWRLVRRRARVLVARWHPAVPWILATSIALNVAGIGWGLPAAWAPDEISPPGVLDGLAHAFSPDWFGRYPPLHYAVIGAADLPVLVLHALQVVTLHDGWGFTLLWIAGRLVSVAMAAGVLVAVEVTAREAFGVRSAALAAALMAVVVPFVYYARTANVDVPYLFWFSLSLVFYGRTLERAATRDFVGLALCAGLAVCTKDQAYGLYALMPLPILVTAWTRRTESDGSLAAFSRNAALSVVTGVAVVAVGQNVLLDWHGFVHHLELLAGPASETYQAFPRTAGGHVALERLTGRLVVESMGVPAAAVAAVGVVFALLRAATRLRAIWLIVPVVSYDLTFLHVVLYDYDRFVLPICLVGSIFGGVALDRMMTRAVGRVVPAIVLVYGLLCAIALDALTIGDSRYAARRWLDAHRGANDRIAIAQPTVYLPRVDDLDPIEIDVVDDLVRQRPDFVILNDDYARASAGDPVMLATVNGLDGGRLGVRLAVRLRTRAPFPWLPGQSPDLVGPRTTLPVTSILRNVNPEISVFGRVPTGRGR